jgi:hypothetical protein
MRITRNPYQRVAAGCALLALIASLTAYPPAAVPVLLVGLVFALRAEPAGGGDRVEPAGEATPAKGPIR